MIRALAIDTTSAFMSLALQIGDTIAANRYERCGTEMNRTLLHTVAAVLDEAETQPVDLDVIVVAAGPGSFTGTRLGMAVAKTFAQVLGTPLVGVDTLHVLAAQTDPTAAQPFHALLHCTRNELYQAPFCWDADGKLKMLRPITLEPVDRVAQIVSDAPVVMREFDGPRPPTHDALARFCRAPLRYPHPDGERLLAVGLPRFLAAPTGPFAPVEPVYLKSEAFRKWKPGA